MATIKARKGERVTTFTEMAWQYMGKEKNGWIQISDEEYEADKPVAAVKPAKREKTLTAATPKKETPAKDVGKADGKVGEDLTYAEIIEQAKGFEKDEKWAEAIAKYQQAHEVKPSPYLKGKITALGKKLTPTPTAFEQAVSDADKAFDDKDYGTAFELYGAADGLQAGDAHVTARLTECEELLK